MIERIKHRGSSGKYYGEVIKWPDGRAIYMAYRSGIGKSSKGYFAKKDAWCFDTDTLRFCRRHGCHAVGVEHHIGKVTIPYLTNIEDLEGPPSEPHLLGTTPQRRLARSLFRIDGRRLATVLGKTMTLGRLPKSR